MVETGDERAGDAGVARVALRALAGGIDVDAGEAAVVAAERPPLVAEQLLAEARQVDAQVAVEDDT